MEMGFPQNPEWLKSYVSDRSGKKLRKKFSLNKSEKIIMGLGQAEDLESARTVSQLNARKKAAEMGIGQTGDARLSFIYEYWEEDDEKGFLVYSLYAF